MKNLVTTIARLYDHLILVSSMDYGSGYDKHKQLTKETITTLNQSSPQRCVLECGDYVFYYQISDGIVYITLCERNYPKKLAFEYLQELSVEFLDEFGRAIPTFSRAYAAISFDSTMEKIRNKYVFFL